MVRKRDLARAKEVVPPPSSPTCDTEWWGARNGREARTPSPPARRPATEWSWVASSVSSRVSLGRIVVIRRASMVLPAPGEPTSSTLWAPAAATSSARRAWCCPRTSAKSTAGSVGAARQLAGASVSAAPTIPSGSSTTSRSVLAPTTWRPSTCAASRALTSGTMTPSKPRRAAAIATESTPGVGMSSPFSESSPAKANRANRGDGTCAVAASTPIATGRSSPGPSLRMLPGARLTTTLRRGHSIPDPSTAGRMRSQASLTAAPGNPVRVREGSPRPTCASTVTT